MTSNGFVEDFKNASSDSPNLFSHVTLKATRESFRLIGEFHSARNWHNKSLTLHAQIVELLQFGDEDEEDRTVPVHLIRGNESGGIEFLGSLNLNNGTCDTGGCLTVHSEDAMNIWV